MSPARLLPPLSLAALAGVVVLSLGIGPRTGTVAVAQEELGPGARLLTLKPNPLAGVNDAAPEELAYDLPPERIVQLGPGNLANWIVTQPLADRAKLFAPWDLIVSNEKVNEVGFTYPDDSVRYRRDLRDIPINEHGLPDFSEGPLAEAFAKGRAKVDTGSMYDIIRDPDWAQWIAGRYELIVEHPEDEELNFEPRAVHDEATVTGPSTVRLEDGYVRKSWTIDAPLGVHYVRIAASGNTDDWRRLSLYHVRDWRGEPTGDREWHEAGGVWSKRYLRLFADRYNAVRHMDLMDANRTVETHFEDRCTMAEETQWTNKPVAMDYAEFPWDAARYLAGDHCQGPPLEAVMRLGYEASLVAREMGLEGHVLNPQVQVPQRLEGPELDAFLGAVAEHVAFASANGVDYDHVKIELGNEIWNHGPGWFRDDHCYFAGYPKTRFSQTEERDPRYVDQSAEFEATEPWYVDWDTLQKDSCVNIEAAMKSAARRMVHVVSRAMARHPDINWIGGYSGWTGQPWTVPYVFAGARDGAEDVERWAREGDDRGDHAYAVVPRDEDGRPMVGSLFTYSLTTYWNVSGGPGRKLLGGMNDLEIAQRAKDGTLADKLYSRFVSAPAKGTGEDERAFYDTLAGMRQSYAEMIGAIAKEGGAMLDFYEGGSHMTENHSWPEQTKQAFRAWQDSPEHAELQDRLHDVTEELGFIGVTDFAFAGKDEDEKGGLVQVYPWLDENDPYEVEPWEAVWAKRMTPLAPPPPSGD